jgi:hypothetical protein
MCPAEFTLLSAIFMLKAWDYGNPSWIMHAVYSQHLLSGGKVRKWCWVFKHGRTDVHDEEQSGRSTICGEWCSYSEWLTKKTCEWRRFTISELLSYFRAILQRWRWISQPHCTWVNVNVNVKEEKQSTQWVHTHSPTIPNKFKQTLSAYQEGDNSCFVGQETSADGGIHATRDHNNVRSLLPNN